METYSKCQIKTIDCFQLANRRLTVSSSFMDIKLTFILPFSFLIAGFANYLVASHLLLNVGDNVSYVNATNVV